MLAKLPNAMVDFGNTDWVTVIAALGGATADISALKPVVDLKAPAAIASVAAAVSSAPAIPTVVTAVSSGIGGLYVYDATVNSAFLSTWPGAGFLDAAGRGFRYANAVVNVKHFGAVGDGVVDDTAAIQNAINYALYGSGRGCEVYIPSGTYKTSDTIHIGYGLTYGGTPYTQPNVYGSATRYNTVCGTRIVPTFRDRPVFAISGGRQTRLRLMSIVGDETSMLNKWSAAGAHDTANWVVGTWGANAFSRYAPFCAIAVDPYNGTAPSPAYPNVTFPSFLGSPAQYGKSPSSDTLFESIHISGFAAGIVYSPSGNSAQDDFARIRNCWIQRCVQAVSIGHTDARLMTIDNSYLPENHTGLTGTVHGQQLGQCGAAHVNNGFDRSVQWFDFGDIYNERTGSVTFLDCYSENGWRLGNFGSGGGAGGANTLKLDNCRFKPSETSLNGRPATILSTSLTGNIIIEGGLYQGVQSWGGLVIQANPDRVRIEGVGLSELAVATNEYEMRARMALPIVIYHPSSGTGYPRPLPAFHANWRGYSLSTLASAQNIVQNEYARLSKNTTATPYSRWIAGTRTNTSKYLANPAPVVTFQRTALSAATLVGLDLTLTFNSRTDFVFNREGPLPGDVLIDHGSGSVFYVYSRTGTTIIAKLQNNYRGTTGAYVYVNPVDLTLTSSTLFVCVNSRVFMPANYTKGVVTESTSTITACGDDNNNSTNANVVTDIPVNSVYLDDTFENRMFISGGVAHTISAVSNSLITLSGTVIAGKNYSGQLGPFLLPAPTNSVSG